MSATVYNLIIPLSVEQTFPFSDLGIILLTSPALYLALPTLFQMLQLLLPFVSLFLQNCNSLFLCQW